MRNHYLGALALIAMAIWLGIARPMPTQAAAAPTVKVSNVLLDGLTKNETGAVTAIFLQTTTQGNQDLTTFKANSATTYLDARNKKIRPAFISPLDTVSVTADKLSGGTAISLIDKSVWSATLTGRVSGVSDTSLSFNLTIVKHIKEINKDATYTLPVSGLQSPTIVQVEKTKVGNKTTRVLKTRTWTNVNDNQTVTVTGNWNSHLQKMQATKIQLPELSL
jgi:hypothetical protein